MGKHTHYQLLGVGIRANDEEVLRAYNRLARVVHRSHAERLGLTGKEDALAVLFEQATEAYLVLSDPRRRASYNTIVGIQLTTEVESVQREEEKRSMARQNYRKALHCLSSMDYSLAIDLLKEASRLDPRPEYYAKLGQVLVKNPNWHGQSVASYRRAVELAPDDVGIRVGFGETLEAMDKAQDAIEQYKAAIELMPNHPVAVGALERLGAKRGWGR
jgi:curved DNA-binding protein CbpA